MVEQMKEHYQELRMQLETKVRAFGTSDCKAMCSASQTAQQGRHSVLLLCIYIPWCILHWKLLT
jgi:hypothetical protein